MKRKKQITFDVGSFGEPIFGGMFEVYFGNVNDIRSYYEQHYGYGFDFQAESEGEEAAAFAFKDQERGIHGMVFNKRPENSVIAHECSHVARMVLGAAGLPHTPDTDECYSYYLGFLVEGVASARKAIKDNKKKKAPKVKKAKKKT